MPINNSQYIKDPSKGEHPSGLTYQGNQQESLVDSVARNSISLQDFLVPQVERADSFSEQLKREAERTRFNSDVESMIQQNTEDEFRKWMEKGTGNANIAVEDIRDLAYKVSPYYRKYNEEYDLDATIGESGWKQMAVNYQSQKQAYGEQTAIQNLKNSIQDIVSRKQTLFEKSIAASNEFLTTFTGSLISVAGIAKGLYDLRVGNIKGNPYLSEFENIVNAAIDNDWSRYGNDIIEHGAFDPKKIEKAKEIGLPDTAVIETSGQEQGTDSFWDQIFNENTLFKAFGQAGFTAGMMVQALATDGLFSAAFRGLKAGSLAARTAGIIKTQEALKTSLSTIQKIERGTHIFVTPALAGTGEGVIEGLQTKLTVLEQGAEAVNDSYRNAVMNDITGELEEMGARQVVIKNLDGTERIAFIGPDGNEIDTMALFEKHSKSREKDLQDSLNQLEFTAAKAGIGNFMINSAINGVINSTFKAALLAPRTQQYLANSKLLSWTRPSSKFNVDVLGNKYSVTAKLSPWKKAYHYFLKEPIGEFTEEYLQTLSDETMRGMADFNLHTYLEKKFSPNAQVAVGEEFSGQWGAAWSAIKKAALSQEAFKAGIYGAIGSMMGAPAVRTRFKGVAKDEKGNRIKGVKGLLKTVSSNSPIYWRFGARANYLAARESGEALTEQAEMLEEWLNDSNNRAKFDGAAGTLAWGAEMKARAAMGDQFGFRASKLGKTVNDIFMLQKLKGTSVYDQIMGNISTAASMEENSEDAARILASVRENETVSEQHGEKDDHTLFTEIKENASDMLSLIEKIGEYEKEFNRLYSDNNGEIDQDLKESLIYNRLLKEDLERRMPELASVIDTVNGKMEALSEGQIAKLDNDDELVLKLFGSFEQAFRTRDSIESNIEQLKHEIKESEEDGKGKDKEVLIQKMELKQQEKVLELIDKIKEKYNGEVPVISAQAILNASSDTRAKILSTGKKKFYEEIHKVEDTENPGTQTEEKQQVNYFGSEQQDIIDKIMTEGNSVDADFLNKVVDYSKMETTRSRLLQQEIAILSNKDSFNAFAYKAKVEAKKALAKGQAEELDKIEDYTEFSKALMEISDKYRKDGDNISFKTLSRYLTQQKNENFKKFQEERNQMMDIFSFIERTNYFAEQYNDNNINLLLHSLTYMLNNGMSLSDSDSMERILSETDAEGYTSFDRYIDSINEEIEDEDSKLVKLDKESMLKIYLDLMNKYFRYKEEQARKEAPIEITDDNGTTVPVRATPPSVPVNDEVDDNSNEDDNDNPDLDDLSESSRNIIESVNRNNDEELTAALGEAISYIKNKFIDGYLSRLHGYLEVGKDQLIEALENELAKIKDVSFESLDDMAIKISMISPGNENTHINDTLKVLLTEIRKQIIAYKSGDNTTYPNVQSRNRRLYGNVNSAVMSTINLENVVRAHPDSPVAKFIRDNGIIEYIRDKYQSNVEDNGNPDIYYYVDPDLARDVYDSMGVKYRPNDLPVILVIRDDANGTITVGNEKYQPIGIMPSTPTNTSENGALGSANMAAIRNLAPAEGGFVMFNGEKLYTKPIDRHGGVIATSSDVNYNGEPLSIATLIPSLYTEEEKNQIEDNPEKKKTIFNRVIDYVIGKMSVIPGLNRSKIPVYIPGNLKGGQGSPIQMSIRSIENTTNADGWALMPIIKGFLGNQFIQSTAENVSKFNSITKNIKKILTEESDSVYRKIERLIDLVNNSGSNSDIINLASSIVDLLNNPSFTRKIRDLLYFDSNYKITASRDDSTGIISIDIVNADSSAHIKNIVKIDPENDNLTPEIFTAKIITGIITRNGEFDKEGTNEFARWQFDYEDITKVKTGDRQDRIPARARIANLIRDNILELKGTSLGGYTVLGIQTQNPFVVKDGETSQRDFDINTDNASPIRSAIEEPQQPVPTQSGLSQNVLSTIDKIKEDSNRLHLDDNELFYVDGDGNNYYRVSTIKDASDEIDNPFDQSSPYALPSHAIGNVIDQFIRDFFSGSIRTFDVNERTNRRSLLQRLPKNKSLGFKNFDYIRDLYIDSQTGNIVIEFSDPSIENIRGTLSFNPNNSAATPKLSYRALDENNLSEDDRSILSRDINEEQITTVMNSLLEENSALRTLDTSAGERNAREYGIATVTGDNVDSAIANILLNKASKEYGIDVDYNYPIVNTGDLRALRESLERIRNKWLGEGWTIVANDIKAIGKVSILSPNNEIIEKNVAGTLDILLINGNNEFKVVDIKTIRKNARYSFKQQTDKRTTSWRLQTSLYAKFLKERYGLTLVGQEILPIEVTYNSATQENPYSLTSEGELVQNNTVVKAGATLKDIIPLTLINLNPVSELSLKTILNKAIFERLSKEEKEALKEAIKELKEALAGTGEEGSEVYTQESEDDSEDDSFVFSVFPESDSGNVASPTSIVDYEHLWDNLKDESRRVLEKLGFTRETWDNCLHQPEYECIIKCQNL